MIDNKKIELIDTLTRFDENADGLLITQYQEIPQEFLSDVKRRREASKTRREGEFMLVAQVPIIVHEQWLKEGFDMTREPHRETLKRLHSKGLDGFIATNKRV